MKLESPTPRQLREALTCTWDYGQIFLFVREVKEEAGQAWHWATPRWREALIAEKAFAVVRAQHRGEVVVKEMDRLLGGMRVVAGLATLEEVT